MGFNSSFKGLIYQNDIWYMSLCIDDRLVCRFGCSIQICTPNGHLYRVTYTRCRFDTINSPDDGHMAARSMQRIEINIHEKRIVPQVGYL